MTRGENGFDETRLVIRNAFKLGGSLLFTWSIAIAMRLLVPRYLGPDRFGTLSFADAFTATFFVVLGLGVDAYVRTRVSVRPAHASDFFGGTFVLRVVMSGGIVVAMAIVMLAMNRAPEVKNLVYLFALAQFFATTNATLSAVLHAKGNVGGMSVLAVATKIAWAAGVLLAIAVRVGLWGFAVSYAVSEAIETVVLFGLARRHLKLAFRVDLTATKAMVVSSMPYYLNAVATTAYGKLDVTLLAATGSASEVGWYSGASAIAGLSLLLTPLIGWVLMPTFARAAARSREELFARIHRSMELILAVVIPVSMLVILGADVCIRVVFGAAYAPAVPALRILSATFVVTYVAIVYAITLIMLDRAWTLTAISMAGLVVNLLLNLVLVRRGAALFGDGGGGAGCALSMLGTELFVTSSMVSIVGRKAFDRRTLTVVAKSIPACALAVVVDRLAAGIGPARLVLDAVVYGIVIVAVGGLRVGEIAGIVKAAFSDREGLVAPR